MSYLAIINTPGYLPESEPLAFPTVREAWEHLAGELRDTIEHPAKEPDELVAMDILSKPAVWSLVADEESATDTARYFKAAGLGMDGTGHFTVDNRVYEVRLNPVTRSNR